LPFQMAGADIITVHQESCIHLYRTIQTIKESGCKAGVSINPSTPVDTLKNIIEEVDLVLIMTVEPGFGGQKFIKKSVDKIRQAKEMIGRVKKEIYLEVDGGIDQDTAGAAIEAGANVIVAGTSVFSADSMKNAISAIRNAKRIR
jgi:ribulose-phosphate 3-epimerase